VEVDLRENLAPITTLMESQGFEVLVEQDPLLRKTDLCYVYAIRPSATGGLIREQTADGHLTRVPPPDETVLTPATLRKSLKERLPQYMVPAAFVLMDALPLTANGKIDRQALPPFVREGVPAAAEPARAQTRTEQTLAALWADLLKVETVGLHDDFFDLGGQSLLAIQAVSRIRDAFAVDLPLRNLFDKPTVAGLAEVIDGLSWLANAGAPAQGSGAREEIEL
jgi:iturin family lipopeptide synthetase A/iturin family lipopeptide synthetase C/tyrocidine synthetase-3